ncbi:hypothetical protein EV421DRAFT_1907100 [Armillaria borealis]|uniref:CxC2-like cysteine cluster KDZ transposase-associated domain-containing protein n=1 Tax=Armillaria borealis TaxID=47425 RepID=A0AA39MLA8_9AGAR|nr:hypothetical protein EV421DRAFT_1907100 [Armillaria borealis]
MSGWKQYAPAFAMDVSGELVKDLDPKTGKRKRYDSSDDPMYAWLPFRQDFLDELLRQEEFGNHTIHPSCKAWLSSHMPTTEASGSSVPQVNNLFRCETCSEFLECKACSLQRHARTPLHVLKRWNGRFWEDTTLKEMGLVFQLGHAGTECPIPGLPQTLTILHVNGLMHNGWYPATMAEPRSCATFECLDTFRLLSVVANVNVRDYVSTLEQKVDSWGMQWVPDRYKAFGRMSRQWAYLKHLKRAGVGHLKAGIHTAEEGLVAIVCWACPREGVNLPTGWRDSPAAKQYIYRLLVRMDANFRLKNRLRKRNKHKKDGALYSGLGYQVPNDDYFDHLKKYVNETDISTCIAFAALMQKDTRLSTGLRCTGVGGCICIRHELVRPLGLGDLLKGERYANMDYIFWSSIKTVRVKNVTLSYDVGCQYKINMEERRKKLPFALRRDDGSPFVDVALPVWHSDIHVVKCKTENLLLYQDGWQTKEMHPEVRHDAIEDRVDHHNFRKNVGLGDALHQHLRIALVERDAQVKEFQDIDSTLKRDLRAEWKKKVDDWRADHSRPSPYAAEETSAQMTEAQVRLQLRSEELEEITKGLKVVKKVSMSAFLSMGLELESDQRRIFSELQSSNMMIHRQGKVHALRISFFKKLGSFRKTQDVHMPGVKALIEEEETLQDAGRCGAYGRGGKTVVAISSTRRTSVFSFPSLLCITPSFNYGKVNVRMLLHPFERSLWHGNILSGTGMLTSKYRQAQAALVALRGEESCGVFRRLEPEDIAPVHEVERDAKATKHLGRVGGRESRAQARPVAQKLMWIWTAGGGPGSEVDQGVHKSVRVEWSKALARKSQWIEEVEILREEMKWTIRSLRFEGRAMGDANTTK